MSDIVGGFFSSNVGNDSAYESPGDFNLPASFGSPSDGQERILTFIEVLRSYYEAIETVHEAKTLMYILGRIQSNIKSGVSFNHNVSSFAQHDALEYLARKFKSETIANIEKFLSETGQILVTEGGDYLVFY